MSSIVVRVVQRSLRGCRNVLAGLGLLCALGATMAQASPLSRVSERGATHWHHWSPEAWLEHPGLRSMSVSQAALALQATSEAASEHELSIQLAHGRTVWPLNLRIPAGIHLTAVNGLLPDVPLVAYLHWRRSLDPTRFDFFHPRIGPLLERDLLLRESSISTASTPLAQLVPPPVPSLPPAPPQPHPFVPGPPLPPTPPCPHTPEPSSALIATLLLGSGAWLRRNAGRRL